jgi:Ca-activated chloride channel homolog
MKSWIVLLGVFFFFGVAKSQTKTRVLFILDASNSMNVAWGNETRIHVAKEVLSQEIESLRGIKNVEIALRIYGHQSVVTNSFQDCNDTRLEVPFGKDNLTAIKEKIKTIQAKGATPIARSLEASASDFPDTLAKYHFDNRRFGVLRQRPLRHCEKTQRKGREGDSVCHWSWT